MRPPAPAADWAIHSVKPIFGADTGPVPDSVLARSGFLRTALERAGMKIAKITPWQESPSGDDESRRHYQSLAEEVRHLRSAGIGVVGVIAPPKAVFDSDRLRTALEARPDRLGAILADAGRHLGLFVDTWQWGDDGDDSFAGIPAGPALDGLASTLRDFAGAMPVAANAPFVMPVAANAPFVPGERPAFPIRPDIVQARMPDTVQAAGLWPLAAGVFPWLFEPYYNLRGSIYPPENLAVLAPGPAADRLEEEARLARRGGSWISLEAPPARSHEPNAAAERVQLEEMMIRAVYAAVLAPDAVFLGSLFDPARGLLRQADAGGTTLETMARPSYLAAATLVRFLEGASYLGRLWLLPPFEAHAFRLPGTNAAVIAVWHNDPRGELTIPRVEIANGPDLAVVDWAGNREPVPADVRVRRAPSFITGVPADLLLTRMSARVVPDPPMLAMNRRQAQAVEMVNHMDRQAPVLLRLRYAARLPEGAMENNWMQQPAEMRLNLPPVTPDLEAGLLRYEVTPDANSLIQIATPDGADKSGLKIAQARMFFHTSPAADMTVYLPFRLRSDIDLDVTALATEESSQFVVLQLKLRWFPSGDNRRRGDIKLTPYYMKRGRMKESAAFPVTVKAQDPSLRGQADAPFDSIELRIPRSPRARTWVGLDEVGGSRFYIADVTAFLDGE